MNESCPRAANTRYNNRQHRATTIKVDAHIAKYTDIEKVPFQAVVSSAGRKDTLTCPQFSAVPRGF